MNLSGCGQMPVSIIIGRRWWIQRIIEGNLLRNGKLAATTARTVEALAAAIIGAPLAECAVRAGMFFGRLVGHQ